MAILLDEILPVFLADGCGYKVGRSILMLEASMPSAVNAFILATNYRRNRELAAITLFVSTIVSPGTITLLYLR